MVDRQQRGYSQKVEDSLKLNAAEALLGQVHVDDKNSNLRYCDSITL